MRRYEQYKPSGLDWLADVPSHWQVVANRALFRARQEAGEDGLPVLSVSLHTGVSDDEQNEEENARTRTRMADRTSYKRVRPGDVAYNMMRAWQGAIGAVRTDGLVSPAYVVAAPTAALNPAYFEYLYRTGWLIGEMNRASKGITDFRKRLYWQEFKQLSTVVPPREDQDRIVAFLDQKISEIDAAIAKKERLTELLFEQQFNTINHVVTQGLDINAPRQPSKEQWLDSYPAHWQLMRIKHVLSAIVDTEHKTPPMYEEGPVLVVRTSNVKGGELTYANAKFTDEKTFSRWTRRATPEAGDILFTREAPAGEACVLPAGVKAIIGQRMVLFKVNAERLDPHFAVHSIYSGAAKVFVELLSVGSTVAHFNMSDIGNIPLLLPPLEEQRAISQKIREIQNQFKPVIASTTSSLEQLRELKHVLIESVVSGQVAVPRE